MLNQLRQVPGTRRSAHPAAFDQPKLHIAIDRTKAANGGYTQNDIADSLLVSLSGSFQTTRPST